MAGRLREVSSCLRICVNWIVNVYCERSFTLCRAAHSFIALDSRKCVEAALKMGERQLPVFSVPACPDASSDRRNGKRSACKSGKDQCGIFRGVSAVRTAAKLGARRYGEAQSQGE